MERTLIPASRASRSRRGDSTSNVIIFLTLLIAGLVVVTWYFGSIRPTRQIIGSVSDDLDGIGRHIANACGSTKYRGTFQPSTPNARLITNGTHYCVQTDIFGSCDAAMCDIEPVSLQFAQGSTLEVTREKDDVVRFAGLNIVPRPDSNGDAEGGDGSTPLVCDVDACQATDTSKTNCLMPSCKKNVCVPESNFRSYGTPCKNATGGDGMCDGFGGCYALPCVDARDNASVCGARVCGERRDDCNALRSCGACASAISCSPLGQCCSDPAANASVCGARVCGVKTDTCGSERSCGACAAGTACDPSGACVVPALPPAFTPSDYAPKCAFETTYFSGVKCEERVGRFCSSNVPAHGVALAPSPACAASSDTCYTCEPGYIAQRGVCVQQLSCPAPSLSLTFKRNWDDAATGRTCEYDSGCWCGKYPQPTTAVQFDEMRRLRMDFGPYCSTYPGNCSYTNAKDCSSMFFGGLFVEGDHIVTDEGTKKGLYGRFGIDGIRSYSLSDPLHPQFAFASSDDMYAVYAQGDYGSRYTCRNGVVATGDGQYMSCINTQGSGIIFTPNGAGPFGVGAVAMGTGELNRIRYVGGRAYLIGTNGVGDITKDIFSERVGYVIGGRNGNDLQTWDGTVVAQYVAPPPVVPSELATFTGSKAVFDDNLVAAVSTGYMPYAPGPMKIRLYRLGQESRLDEITLNGAATLSGWVSGTAVSGVTHNGVDYVFVVVLEANEMHCGERNTARQVLFAYKIVNDKFVPVIEGVPLAPGFMAAVHATVIDDRPMLLTMQWTSKAETNGVTVMRAYPVDAMEASHGACDIMQPTAQTVALDYPLNALMTYTKSGTAYVYIMTDMNKAGIYTIG